jgi:hypothetical protein
VCQFQSALYSLSVANAISLCLTTELSAFKIEQRKADKGHIPKFMMILPYQPLTKKTQMA